MPFDYLEELEKLIKIHNRTKKKRVHKKVIKKLEKFNFLWELQYDEYDVVKHIKA